MSLFARKPERIPPGPGQESAWDYPRPPRLEPVPHRLVVVLGGEVIADTKNGWRVIETSHPPNYYLPPEDIRPGAVELTSGVSFCEFKGRASYYDVRGGDRYEAQAAWGYEHPSPAFAPIAGHLAFYARRMDACYVDDELVTPQDGVFYGGWITSHVVGPFKGGPGTRGW